MIIPCTTTKILSHSEKETVLLLSKINVYFSFLSCSLNISFNLSQDPKFYLPLAFLSVHTTGSVFGCIFCIIIRATLAAVRRGHGTWNMHLVGDWFLLSSTLLFCLLFSSFWLLSFGLLWVACLPSC